MRSALLKSSSTICLALAFIFIGVSCTPARAAAGQDSRAAEAASPSQVLHLADFRVRDPWILAHAPSKTYYLYAMNNEGATGVGRPGTMVYKSKDLREWEGPFLVFVLPEGTWAADQPAWAPEVHEHKGKFYLCTTLHNPARVIAQPPAVWRTNFMRGTVIAASASPEGPFVLLNTNAPVPPADFMTLDGTLYFDPAGKPWMVYAHEWIQKIDGTMEAVPLKDDLSAASGPPIYLFKGSDAPWLDEQGTTSQKENSYVTDGPELFRSKDGHLLMLWSSFDNQGYLETVARSKSGGLSGPWEQLPPLVRQDSGHGMLFRRFDGQLMLVLHRPNHDARAKLFEIEDRGDHLEILRERTDLEGARTN